GDPLPVRQSAAEDAPCPELIGLCVRRRTTAGNRAAGAHSHPGQRDRRPRVRQAERTAAMSFTMNRAEARRASKQLKQRRRGGPLAWWRRMRSMREESKQFPGARGWSGRGTGRAVRVEPSLEVLGTTVQICGYWPFAGGSVSPLVGVPLGLHLTRGFPICADPISYFLADLILNPSLFILGRRGRGKSTVIRRILAVYEAWGYLPL